MPPGIDNNLFATDDIGLNILDIKPIGLDKTPFKKVENVLPIFDVCSYSISPIFLGIIPRNLGMACIAGFANLDNGSTTCSSIALTNLFPAFLSESVNGDIESLRTSTRPPNRSPFES